MAYARSVQVMHWTMGTGMLGCFATVQAAMNTKKDETTLGLKKMEWMTLHKSIALLVAAMLPGRLALRVMKDAPAHLPGNKVEQLGGTATHLIMYGFMTVLPGSGIAMGYFGGKGLPFFGYTIPGATEKNLGIAGTAFKVHKQAGLFFEYFTALHVGAVGFHLLRGHPVLARMGIGAMPK